MGFLEWIPRIQAERTRKQITMEGKRVSSEVIYNLVMVETGGVRHPNGKDWIGGDEEQASEAEFQYLKALRDAGIKPKG